MIVDVVLLFLLRPLDIGFYISFCSCRCIFSIVLLPRTISAEPAQLTGTSIHARSCCSSALHPSAACPFDAQHPSTDDIIPVHGLASVLFGLRTRSLGSGGRRGATLTFGVAFGGIVACVVYVMRRQRLDDAVAKVSLDFSICAKT